MVCPPAPAKAAVLSPLHIATTIARMGVENQQQQLLLLLLLLLRPTAVIFTGMKNSLFTPLLQSHYKPLLSTFLGVKINFQRAATYLQPKKKQVPDAVMFTPTAGTAPVRLTYSDASNM